MMIRTYVDMYPNANLVIFAEKYFTYLPVHFVLEFERHVRNNFDTKVMPTRIIFNF